MFQMCACNESSSNIHSTDINAIYYGNCLLFAAYMFKWHTYHSFLVVLCITMTTFNNARVHSCYIYS